LINLVWMHFIKIVKSCNWIEIIYNKYDIDNLKGKGIDLPNQVVIA
jgi:hypothetical protein